MNSVVQITLTDAQQASYDSLSGPDKSAYLITRLVLQQASNLEGALVRPNVIALLTNDDKSALASLMEAAAEVLQ